MDANLAIICGLTFVIHLIGTLAYAARIAGIRTGHLATALTKHRVGEGTFRAAVTSLVGARFVGVLLAQILLLPCALFIVFVARHI